MKRPGLGWSLPALVLAGAGLASADTLFLTSGKSMKIDALWCDADVCRAALSGGQVELRPADVVKVVPDEEADPEPTPALPPVSEAVQGAPRSVEQLIAEAAQRYALPRSLVRAVARAESSLSPAAVSPKEAQGVMQLMPGTARDLGVTDAFDPAQNIDAGARHLRQLLEKYDGRVAEALAAYNAGVGAVTRHGGVPPYRETRGYIRRIVKDFEKAEKAGDRPSSKKKER